MKISSSQNIPTKRTTTMAIEWQIMEEKPKYSQKIYLLKIALTPTVGIVYMHMW